MDKQRIVILGGGPSGLAAGWKLAERGHDITVLEREEQIGGQSKTIRHGDWRFDLGGHRFFTKYKDVLEEVESLLGDEKLVTSRKSVIRLNKQYIAYPLELADLLSRMNPLVTARAGIDYFVAALRTRLFGFNDDSFESWIVNRFGRTLYDIYFGIYTEKLWGIPPTQISADWAAQRISLIDLWDVFVRLLKLKDESDVPRTYLSEFLYPKYGIGTIPDLMAERIRAKGGRVLANAEVKKLRLEGPRIAEVTFLEKGSPQTIPCDRVIATNPLPEIVESMGLCKTAEEIRLVTNLKFRALRFLNMTLDFPSVTDNTWIYIPEKKYLTVRIQEPRNWSPWNAPEGKTSLILELACNRFDSLWNEKDEVIYRQCVPQLVELGLLKPEQTSKIMDYFSTYMTHAYPIYDLEYKRKIDEALKLCDGVTNLVTLGRQGLFRYNNMDHSLKMAFLAVQYWDHPDQKRMIRSVATEQKGFEAHDQSSPPAEVRDDEGRAAKD
jgi:protoporphyrinogen oxidase